MSDKDENNSVPSESAVKKGSKHLGHNSWGFGKIFWGLLFILVGGLVLANNFGLIEVHWLNVWRLWPLAIIALGLSIFSLRNLIWHIFIIIFIVLSLGAIAWVAITNDSSVQSLKSYETTIQKISDNIKQVEVSIKAGASSLRINTADQEPIVKSKLDSNVANISETSVTSGETQQINLTMNINKTNQWWLGSMQNSWNVNIARNLSLQLNVDAGASDAEIDMSEAQLRAVDIKAGASSVILKIGNKEDVANVNIESGVSSIIIRVPTTSGVQLQIESGLVTKQLANLSEVHENTYESPDYAQSKNKINIISKIGVSSFTIERY